MTEPLTVQEFSGSLKKIYPAIDALDSIAVALSGGPDSFALCRLLSECGGMRVHALTVDHGLRPESADEATRVAEIAGSFPNVTPAILQWQGDKPQTAIQEAARKVRYDLMADYCRAHKISTLFLGHHQEDQAETFLFRLCKGSGLDGLTGMKSVQTFNESLDLVRPFLDIPKERLIATCEAYDISYVRDPSNQNEDYARVRLRKSWPVLESEGLSAKRLAITARRLARAQAALEQIAAKNFSEIAAVENKQVSIQTQPFRSLPEDVAFRILLFSIRALRSDEDYYPRMEKIEDMFTDLYKNEPFRKRTLGGLVFTVCDKMGLIKVEPE